MLNSKSFLYYENERFTYGWYLIYGVKTVGTVEITLNDRGNNSFANDKIKDYG